MRSLRWRIACWYAVSLLSVLGVILGVTYVHLQHELRVERWERAHPGHSDWTLHGSYSEAEIRDIVGELWHLTILYAAPVVALSLAIGYLLATRSFRPVADINRQLGEIGPTSLKRRLHVRSVDREFEAIEGNINLLLARLEDSFRQLTEFSAQVAHELRTPLTLIRLQVEDAEGKIEPALAESLQDELRRLSDYVDQCLLLATAEQGRLELKFEELAPGRLLIDMLESYDLWAKSQHRAIELTKDDDACVSSDPRYLRQVLHGLLTNAMKHGAGPIAIAVERTSSGVLCRIANRIAPNPAPRHGIGIGLRVARALAAALGCGFEIRQEPERFVVELTWPGSASKSLNAATDSHAPRSW
ncbi:sensor kinase CusS [mine drainage metagenome]|uniref:histidine kinase n=1 Tax=mine drainage metagenome TaxID=410659 RepID=A0A1J5SYP7_9ZZZZ